MSNMKTPKLEINERVITPQGPGTIQEIMPIGEYRILLDTWEEVYFFPEDIQKEGNHGKSVD
jgi:hypothetical protein